MLISRNIQIIKGGDILHLNHSFYDEANDTYYGVIYDNTTQKWILDKRKNPQVPAFILTAYNPEYIREYVLEKDCKKVNVSYKWRTYELAEHLGLTNFKEDVRAKKYTKEMVYLDPRLYGADFNITDTYLKDFILAEETKIKDGEKDTRYDNIFQSYLDIETDVPMAPADRDKQQIYMVTSFYEKTEEMYLDILMDSRYDKYELMMSKSTLQKGMNLQKGESLVIDLEDEVTKQWVDTGRKNFDKEIRENKKFNKSKAVADEFGRIIREMTYVITMFTDELEMMRVIWERLMRKKKPNYNQIFNADFDTSHFYRRYKYLGGDPKDLFTDPQIGEYYKLHCKTVREIEGTYRPPREKEMHPCNEPQYYETSTCTNLQDTAVIHYSLRVKKEDSYSLEATAQRTIGFGKLDYSVAGADIFSLPYINFALAAEYCIRDTMVLKGIEMQTNNMTATLVKRNIMNTEFDRLNTSMDYCTNTFDARMRREGEVQRNNVNKHLLTMPRSFYETLKDPLLLNLYDALTAPGGITGGYVASPNKVRKEGKRYFKHIPNYKSHTFTIDLDAEAHYPSAVAANNIGLESLIGQIVKITSHKPLEELPEAYRILIHDSVRIAMKLINRDLIGIGELFGLPSLEKLVEMHYGIACEWATEKDDPSIYCSIRPEANPLITVLKKMFSDKLNKIDKLAEKESLSGMGILGVTEASVRYYGTLVTTSLEENGDMINMADFVLEDYDHTASRAIVSFTKVDDVPMALVNRRPEFLKYISPRNAFRKDNLRMIDSHFISTEVIEAIQNAKDETYRLELGEKHIMLTTRLFAIPVTKNTEVKCTVWTDDDEDVFFEFESKTNIKINKERTVTLNVDQVFSVLA